MWRRRLILVLTLIAVVEIVALGIRGFLAETLITPLLYLVWGAVRIFESIPQGIIWLTFVLAAGIVALVSVWGGRRNDAQHADADAPRGRVYEWQRLVALAQRHDYSRWRLAQRLMILLAETMAARERVELRVARQRIATGMIDAPQMSSIFFALAPIRTVHVAAYSCNVASQRSMSIWIRLLPPLSVLHAARIVSEPYARTVCRCCPSRSTCDRTG